MQIPSAAAARLGIPCGSGPPRTQCWAATLALGCPAFDPLLEGSCRRWLTEKWHNRGWDATENWASSDLEHIQTETVGFCAYIQLFLVALGAVKYALLLLSKTLI